MLLCRLESGFKQGKTQPWEEKPKKKCRKAWDFIERNSFCHFPEKRTWIKDALLQDQVEDGGQYKILGKVVKLLVVSEKIHDVLIGLIAVELNEISILSYYLSGDSIWEWFIDLNELSMKLRKIISTSFTKAHFF